MNAGAGAARACTSLLLALAAAACAVGPDYKRPTAPVSAAYKEQAPPVTPTPTVDATRWKPAEPRDDARRGNWWEVFGDPALSALEKQVTVSNQTIAQSEAEFRAARAVARGARADLFPVLSAGASAARSSAGAPRSTGLPATANSYQLSGDLSWEVDVFGRIRRSVESSVESAQASAADLESVRLALQAELAIDYFELHGIDAQKQLLDTNVAAYQTALQLTINRHQQGVVSGVDVAQAETQLETTRAQSLDLGVARAQLEHAIAVLIGKPPGDFTIPSEPIGLQPPEIPSGIPSELLERRPDVAAAERRTAAANAQVGVATAGFFPRLLLAASGGYASSTLTQFFSLPNRFWSIGPSIAETIFSGGKRRAAREQAQANYEAAVALYREGVLTALQQVEDNLAALRILGQEAAQQAIAIAAAERSLTLARTRYEAGITTYLEVVTAQAVALANERIGIDLLTRRMTASVTLIKALGGGWRASDLPSPGGVLARQEPPTGSDAGSRATEIRPQP